MKDGEQFCLLLISLLRHVSRHLPESCPLFVRLEQKEGTLAIYIEQGEWPPLPHVPDPTRSAFYPLSNTLYRKYDQDLWLCVCQKTVKHLDGQLFLDGVRQRWMVLLPTYEQKGKLQ